MSPQFASVRERLPELTKAEIRRYGPGEMPTSDGSPPAGALKFAPGLVPVGPFTPGDFILTHSKGLTSALIRFGQSLRYWGKNAKYTWWSHAAIIVSPAGDLIEAVGRGVVRTPIAHYRETEYCVVHLDPTVANAWDREQMVRFAECWEGAEYGLMTIVSVALSLLTGSRFVFGIDRQFICSGLVASALERTSTIFDLGAAHIMPADLARHYHVEAGATKGKVPAPNRP